MPSCAPGVVLGTKKVEKAEGLGHVGVEGDAEEPLSLPPTLEAPTSWIFSVSLVSLPYSLPINDLMACQMISRDGSGQRSTFCLGICPKWNFNLLIPPDICLPHNLQVKYILLTPPVSGVASGSPNSHIESKILAFCFKL